MLLIVEKGVIGKMCHAINGYAKVNNKYKKYYDINKEPLHLAQHRKLSFPLRVSPVNYGFGHIYWRNP